MRRAICTILGVPNGSGKSSIFEALQPVGEFVNADAAARLINPQDPAAASLSAGRHVLKRLGKLINERKDFVYETTLSGHQPLDLMRRARSAGYDVGLVFVVLASVDLNVERVAQRVARGGHDIPEDVIRRRFDGSMRRLAQAMPLAHQTLVLENTERELAVLVRVDAGAIETNNLGAVVPAHMPIAAATANALGLHIGDIIGASRNT